MAAAGGGLVRVLLALAVLGSFVDGQIKDLSEPPMIAGLQVEPALRGYGPPVMPMPAPVVPMDPYRVAQWPGFDTPEQPQIPEQMPQQRQLPPPPSSGSMPGPSNAGGSFGWSQQSPLMLPPSSNQDPWDEPPQNLVGYIPRVVRPASPGIPWTYSYGGGAPMSGVVYSKDAQKFRHEGADDDEFDDNAAADNYGLLERSASEKDWRNSAKPGYKKSASSEEFELPYELPSDIDAYSPRVDPFLPTPMDFRSKSLAGSELLKNPMPKGSKSLNCYKCGYACNSRIGVPVICNSPLEQCATFYDPQTLDVTARGCKINGEPGCFLTEDGVYGCTCKSQLCNDFKMYKVTGRIFNELFEPSSKGGKKRVDQETCDPCTKGCNKPCPPPVVPTPPGPETCCKAKANKKKPDKPGICCPPETKKRPTQCCYLDNLPKKYRVKYAHLIREAAGYSSANPVCQSSKSFLAAASAAAAAAFGLLAFA